MSCTLGILLTLYNVCVVACVLGAVAVIVDNIGVSAFGTVWHIPSHKTASNRNGYKYRRFDHHTAPLALGTPSSHWVNDLRWPRENQPGFSAVFELQNTMSSPSDFRHSPSSLRNREVIAVELSKWLKADGSRAGGDGEGCLLEIASGTGCHVEAFAKILPGWTFRPTEYEAAHVPDIAATVAAGGYTNILQPERLDVCSDPRQWPRPPPSATGATERRLWDAVMCSNMIHIAPPECTPGLLAGAAEGLKMNGHLFIYGPFALSGLLAPESNVIFDRSLKERSDGLWGIKDIAFVADLADERGLELTAMTAMPANNFFVAFTKVREPDSTVRSDSGASRAPRVADRVSTVVAPAKAAFVERLSST